MSEMLTKVSWAVGMAMIHADMKVNKVITDAVARAAIEAMREPTFEMLNKGIDCPEDDIKLQWHAMIDEALK